MCIYSAGSYEMWVHHDLSIRSPDRRQEKVYWDQAISANVFCFRMDFLLMLEDDDLSIFELLYLFDRCFKDAFKAQSHKLRLQCISQGMFGNSTDSHAWSGLV